MANVRAAANRHKAAKEIIETVPSLRELLKMKENSVNPLNYSCEFIRLTQLFQRPLLIKYYAKKPQPQQTDAVGKADKVQVETAKFMTEDGEFLEGANNYDDQGGMADEPSMLKR